MTPAQIAKLNPDEWEFAREPDVNFIRGETLVLTIDVPRLSSRDRNIFNATRDAAT